MGPELPIGNGSCHSVAVNAGRRLEYSSPLGNNTTHGRGLPLLLNPTVELIAGLNIDAEKHLGMLRPAILRTLAQVNPRLLRNDPHSVRMVGNPVGCTCHAAHPAT